MMVQILERFDWRVVGMLFHNHDIGKGAGNSPCYFALAAVNAQLDKQGHKSVHKSFDETNGSVNFTQLLLHIGQRSRSESIPLIIMYYTLYPQIAGPCYARVSYYRRHLKRAVGVSESIYKQFFSQYFSAFELEYFFCPN